MPVQNIGRRFRQNLGNIAAAADANIAQGSSGRSFDRNIFDDVTQLIVTTKRGIRITYR